MLVDVKQDYSKGLAKSFRDSYKTGSIIIEEGYKSGIATSKPSSPRSKAFLPMLFLFPDIMAMPFSSSARPVKSA
jgi:hypothetical protein